MSARADEYMDDRGRTFKPGTLVRFIRMGTGAREFAFRYASISAAGRVSLMVVDTKTHTWRAVRPEACSVRRK